MCDYLLCEDVNAATADDDGDNDDNEDDDDDALSGDDDVDTLTQELADRVPRLHRREQLESPCFSLFDRSQVCNLFLLFFFILGKYVDNNHVAFDLSLIHI